MFSGKSYFLICEIIKSNQINYGKGFNKSFIVWDDNDSDQIWATETLMSCCASHTQPGVCAPRRHMEALEFSSLTWPSCLRLQICPNLIGFWLHLRQLLRSVSQPNALFFFFFTKWLQAWIYSSCNERCSPEPEKWSAIQTRETLQSEPCQKVWMASFIWQTSGGRCGKKTRKKKKKTRQEKTFWLFKCVHVNQAGSF